MAALSAATPNPQAFCARGHSQVDQVRMSRRHFGYKVRRTNDLQVQAEPVHFPTTPIALKMAIAIGIGMLAGLERKWSK